MIKHLLSYSRTHTHAYITHTTHTYHTHTCRHHTHTYSTHTHHTHITHTSQTTHNSYTKHITHTTHTHHNIQNTSHNTSKVFEIIIIRGFRFSDFHAWHPFRVVLVQILFVPFQDFRTPDDIHRWAHTEHRCTEQNRENIHNTYIHQFSHTHKPHAQSQAIPYHTPYTLFQHTHVCITDIHTQITTHAYTRHNTQIHIYTNTQCTIRKYTNTQTERTTSTSQCPVPSEHVTYALCSLALRMLFGGE